LTATALDEARGSDLARRTGTDDHDIEDSFGHDDSFRFST
jgi:hypothetical protein